MRASRSVLIGLSSHLEWSVRNRRLDLLLLVVRRATLLLRLLGIQAIDILTLAYLPPKSSCTKVIPKAVRRALTDLDDWDAGTSEQTGTDAQIQESLLQQSWYG